MFRILSLLVAIFASPALGLAAIPATAGGQVGALRRPPVPAVGPKLRRAAGLPIVDLAPEMSLGAGPTSGSRRRLTTTTVTNEAELRNAISNVASGGNLELILGASITVVQQLELSGGQTIVIKPGAGTTISGGGATRVFYVTVGTLSLDGVSVVNGNANGAMFDGGGGCIFVHGASASLTMENGEVKNCQANTAGAGVLVHEATATLNGVTFSGNSAALGGGG